MKRVILSTVLVIALVGTAQAQSSLDGTNDANIRGVVSASDQIPVLTTVIEQLAISAGQALDFGFVTTGANTYPQLQEGQFTITGQPAATILLTEGGATNLDLSGDGNVTVSGVSYSSSDAISTTEIKLPTGGSSLVNISGTLNLTGSATTGDYSGIYELNVAYTSL